MPSLRAATHTCSTNLANDCKTLKLSTHQKSEKISMQSKEIGCFQTYEKYELKNIIYLLASSFQDDFYGKCR